VRALALAALALLVALGHATIPALAAASFLVVAGKAFHDAAAQALVPHVVGRTEAELTRANGRIFAGETVSQTVAGPPLGGATFGVTPWLPFALDAASFAGSAALLRRVPAAPAPARSDEQRITAAVAEGFRYLLRNRELLTLALSIAVFNLAYNLAYATFVLYAQQALHVTSFGFGLLVAATAAGAGIAGWIAPHVVRRLTIKGTILATLFAEALAWAVIAASSSAWIAGVALVLLGAGTTLATVAVVSARQQLVPDLLLGRVVSAFRLIGNGIAPIGAALGGVIATTAGLRAPLVVAPAVLVAAVGLLAALLRATGSRSPNQH
jgi:predicted MFS family arabinose efflux permease